MIFKQVKSFTWLELLITLLIFWRDSAQEKAMNITVAVYILSKINGMQTKFSCPSSPTASTYTWTAKLLACTRTIKLFTCAETSVETHRCSVKLYQNMFGRILFGLSHKMCMSLLHVPLPLRARLFSSLRQNTPVLKCNDIKNYDVTFYT